MRYEVAFDRAAEDDLSRMSPVVASHVLDQIDRLAEEPVKLSRPGSFPYPLVQQFRFDAEMEGAHHYFVVLFQYGQREDRLHILAIAHQAI